MYGHAHAIMNPDWGTPAHWLGKPKEVIMIKFSEIITPEDQYEVAKCRATLAFLTMLDVDVLTMLLDRHFPIHSVKV